MTIPDPFPRRMPRAAPAAAAPPDPDPAAAAAELAPAVPARWRRAGLLLCLAAQLITISALNSVDPAPATWAALTGLLAVTGMRISEAIRPGRDDVILDQGRPRVIGGRPGKSREVPLAPGMAEALRRLAATRGRLRPGPRHGTFSVSTTGTRLTCARARETFTRLCRQAGVTARPPRCRHRPVQAGLRRPGRRRHLRFPDHPERDRGLPPRSRNVRLAAIRSLFSYRGMWQVLA